MTLFSWVGIAILILKLKEMPRLSDLAFVTEIAELEFEVRSDQLPASKSVLFNISPSLLGRISLIAIPFFFCAPLH